jgi:hypothetical protein
MISYPTIVILIVSIYQYLTNKLKDYHYTITTILLFAYSLHNPFSFLNNYIFLLLMFKSISDKLINQSYLDDTTGLKWLLGFVLGVIIANLRNIVYNSQLNSLN